MPGVAPAAIESADPIQCFVTLQPFLVHLPNASLPIPTATPPPPYFLANLTLVIENQGQDDVQHPLIEIEGSVWTLIDNVRAPPLPVRPGPGRHAWVRWSAVSPRPQKLPAGPSRAAQAAHWCWCLGADQGRAAGQPDQWHRLHQLQHDRAGPGREQPDAACAPFVAASSPGLCIILCQAWAGLPDTPVAQQPGYGPHSP